MALRIRRGTEAERVLLDGSTVERAIPASGELLYTTDSKKLYVGDSVTPGGNGVSAPVTSVNGRVGVVNLTTDMIPEGDTAKFFTNERALDAIGPALEAGNAYSSGITFTYDDDHNRITAVASVGTSYTDEQARDAIGAALVAGNGSNTGITFTYGSTEDTANIISATVTAAADTFKTITFPKTIVPVLTAGGNGYVDIPSVSISNPPLGGTAATVSVTLVPTYLRNIAVTGAGSGYSDGVKAVAAATACVSGIASGIVDPITGSITGFTITHPGSGFQEIPDVVVTKPPVATATYVSGGTSTTITVGLPSVFLGIYRGMVVTGTGFSAGQKVTGVTFNLTTVTLTLSAGAATTPSGTLTFTDPGVGGTAIAFLATTHVKDVTIDSAGSGYLTAPTITIDPPAQFSFNAATDVNVTTNSITISNHPFLSGEQIKYSAVGGTAITAAGISEGATVYVIKVDEHTIKLAATTFNAQAQQAIDITAAGTGTNSFRGIGAEATTSLQGDVVADNSTDTLTINTSSSVGEREVIIRTVAGGDQITLSVKDTGLIEPGGASELAFYTKFGNQLSGTGETLTFQPPLPGGNSSGALLVNGNIIFHSNFPKIYSDVANLVLASTAPNGEVVIGDSTNPGRLGIQNNEYVGPANGSLFRIQQAHGTVDIGDMRFVRSRGTTITPLANTAGDAVGKIQFAGHDGTAYHTHAIIRTAVDGPVTTGKVPGRIEFYTRNSSTDTAPVLALKLNGNTSAIFSSTVSATGFITTGSGTPSVASATNLDLSAAAAVRVIGGGTFRLPQISSTARSALTAANGDLIYNTTDNKVQAYQDGSWINLDGTP